MTTSDALWAITPEGLTSMLAALDGEGPSTRPDPPPNLLRKGIYVSTVFGPISRYPMHATNKDGTPGGQVGTSISDIRNDLRTALAADHVKKIVLVFDTTGGTTQGLPELAGEIRRARSHKAVLAYVDGFCATAGYWVAAQCSSIHATESAMVGSIGIITEHVDMTERLAEEGHQGDDLPRPLAQGRRLTGRSPDRRGRGRDPVRVDALYARFVCDVAAGRRVKEYVVRRAYGEGGRIVMTREALRFGMIDSVGSLSEVLASAEALSRKRLSRTKSA